VKGEEFERIKRHDTKGPVRSDRAVRMRAIVHNLQQNIWESLPLRLSLYRLKKDTTNRIQHREMSNFCRLAFNDDKQKRKKTGNVGILLTMRCVRVTTVSGEKQQVLHRFCGRYNIPC